MARVRISHSGSDSQAVFSHREVGTFLRRRARPCLVHTRRRAPHRQISGVCVCSVRGSVVADDVVSHSGFDSAGLVLLPWVNPCQFKCKRFAGHFDVVRGLGPQPESVGEAEETAQAQIGIGRMARRPFTIWPMRWGANKSPCSRTAR